MSENIASFEKWKQKKKGKSGKGNRKNNFAKKRQWVTEEKQIKEVVEKYNEFDATKVESFEEYPLSSKTKMGLQEAGYVKPTAIQRASFNASIHGRDVLGAAKTGSGKTLAFLIPVLECLYRERWSSIAGPGALIISPTRELAYQTFEVLKKIGKFHDFSAGLIIGGKGGKAGKDGKDRKDVKREAARIPRTNILICTPGRLLQHMDQTVHFDASTLQVLVLDEADRILDMGFKATLNAIIGNLPSEKQTLLFSATQTKSVKDLARLSLREPAYVAPHEKSKSSTPSGLDQNYIVCEQGNKLNILYSFVKTHLKKKTLVFLMSCKQVQYVYAVFCKLRPGVPIMMLHGKMNQMRRMAVYDEFCRKKFALLFCTDIASRGLDFPAIDWVVQMDCPEDAETYVHRAGRTARYHGEGHALLFLLESEKEGMLQQMKEGKVPISKTEINTEKITNISSRLGSFCAEDIEFKQRAQRCFMSYVRSVHLMKNKSVFSVQSIPLAEYSASLGLAVTPKVRFLQRQRNNRNEGKVKGSSVGAVSADKNFKKNTQADDQKSFDIDDGDGDEVADMFSVKKPNVFEEESDSNVEEEKSKDSKEVSISKVGAIKKLLKKKYKYNQKMVFDEKGKLAEAWPPVDPKAYEEGLQEPKENPSGIDIERAKAEMKERDLIDRQQQKLKVKQKHQEIRWKQKESRRSKQAVKEGRSRANKEDETVALLGNDSDVDDEMDSADYNQVSDHDDNSAALNRSVDDISDNEMPAKRLKRTELDDKNQEELSDTMDDNAYSLKDDEKFALYLLQR